jgi:Flp pilus assembly pilin Flp
MTPPFGGPKRLRAGRVPGGQLCVCQCWRHMVLAQVCREDAQSLVEFGLLLALVAVVSIVGLLVFGSTVGALMSNLSHTVSINMNP